ncbi:hypothetical protein PshuTeo2_09910 [Pseudomonas hunanensis]|nr:hypothetical protein [Pseudomonas hunanensis]
MTNQHLLRVAAPRSNHDRIADMSIRDQAYPSGSTSSRYSCCKLSSSSALLTNPSCWIKSRPVSRKNFMSQIWSPIDLWYWHHQNSKSNRAITRKIVRGGSPWFSRPRMWDKNCCSAQAEFGSLKILLIGLDRRSSILLTINTYQADPAGSVFFRYFSCTSTHLSVRPINSSSSMRVRPVARRNSLTQRRLSFELSCKFRQKLKSARAKARTIMRGSSPWRSMPRMRANNCCSIQAASGSLTNLCIGTRKHSSMPSSLKIFMDLSFHIDFTRVQIILAGGLS